MQGTLYLSMSSHLKYIGRWQRFNITVGRMGQKSLYANIYLLRHAFQARLPNIAYSMGKPSCFWLKKDAFLTKLQFINQKTQENINEYMQKLKCFQNLRKNSFFHQFQLTLCFDSDKNIQGTRAPLALLVLPPRSILSCFLFDYCGVVME